MTADQLASAVGDYNLHAFSWTPAVVSNGRHGARFWHIKRINLFPRSSSNELAVWLIEMDGQTN